MVRRNKIINLHLWEALQEIQVEIILVGVLLSKYILLILYI